MVPTVLSESEVDRLLEAARSATERAAPSDAEQARRFRLHALVELLYATGLRVSELVALPRAAMRSEARFFTMRGKGGHERIVPLSDKAKAAAADYLAIRDAGGVARAARQVVLGSLSRDHRPLADQLTACVGGFTDERGGKPAGVLREGAEHVADQREAEEKKRPGEPI